MYKVKNHKDSVRFNCIILSKIQLRYLASLSKFKREEIINFLVDKYHFNSYHNTHLIESYVERDKIKQMLNSESFQKKIRGYIND